MFHITLTIKNVHGIDPFLIARGFIEGVLCIPNRTIKGYCINKNAQRIVFSAYYDSHPLVEPYDQYIEAYFTSDGTNWGEECTGIKCDEPKLGFTHITKVTVSNCGDTFEFYQHEYPDSYIVPDTITYQVLDLADAPKVIPGYTLIDKQPVYHLYKNDKQVCIHVVSFARTPRGVLNIHSVMDATFTEIQPAISEDVIANGKYLTWLTSI